MGPTKVFVGNLSFKTKEGELAEEFSTAGKVITANIITRGYRSLGYGFVEFESEQEAQAALNTLNKKNINGREINVELATPRDESAPRPSRPRRGSGLRGRGGHPPRDGDSPNLGERRGGYSPRGGRGGGGPYRRNNGPGNANSPAPNSPAANAPNNNNDNNDQRSSRGGRNYRRNYKAPPRSPQNTNRVPSSTTLFVANLPYQMSDNELFDLLPKATKAYVAKNYNGRSKGFGFIEFANEDDQKAALNTSEKLQAQGRDLIVKIALTEGEKRPEVKNENQPRT